jgi:hypothetical protein
LLYVSILIIDEKSFLGKNFLLKLNRILQEVKQNYKDSFGNVKLILLALRFNQVIFEKLLLNPNFNQFYTFKLIIRPNFYRSEKM